MLTSSFCGNSDSADPSNKEFFQSFRTVHSSPMPRERATPAFVQDILGHVNIDVTQNVYGNNWWKERVDAATQALEGVTNAAQNAEKEKNQLESVSLAGLDVQHRNRLLSRM